MAAVDRIEASLGSPPGTIMLGQWRVSLDDAPEVSRVEESQTQGVIEQQTQSAGQTEDAQQGEQVEEVEQAAQPQLKALVWFWLIDETLSVNLVYQSDYEIGSTTPSDAKIMMMVMAW